MSYKNREGYNDPTAGIAIGKLTREERKKRKALRRQRGHLDDRIPGTCQCDNSSGGEGLQNRTEKASG